MNYNDLANLIFPNITETIDDLEKRLIVLQMLDHLLNSEKCKNMYRLSKEEYELLKEVLL